VNGHTVETLAGCAGGALRCRLPPDVLGSLLRTLAAVSWDLLEPRGLSLTSLTMRERNVLRLVAEGLPTREVAQRLSYSERSIKAVMDDVTTTLHAKSRSQAVALAVREGLI
jgi:DNA-binding NarL/FixJ family response regulator